MAKTLFVIEAPGKIKSMEGILSKAGQDAIVQATGGHLYEFPDDLDNLGIDGTYRETKRQARSDKTIHYLRKAAREAETIIVATDADSEGDVIAWDVHELVRDICPHILRVRLKGMDPDSVTESLTDASPVKKKDAIPGRTRAILDRVIGKGFSKDGVGVGRVSTSLLGVLHHGKGKVSTKRVRLVAPAKDGTNPWVATFDTNAVVTNEIADQLTQLAFPAIDMKARKSSSNKAMHMGDVMVRAGDELGMTPKESSKSLQTMYETGQMSYPRSGSKGVSKGAQRRLARMIKKSGFRGRSERIAEKGDEDVHDAPYPIGDVDVSKDPRKLGDDHGVRTMVAREYVKSSINRDRQKAEAAEIRRFLLSEGYSEKVADHVSKLNWTREIGPRFPGENSWPESGIEERMPETVLLEKAVGLNLGRPSTWANHIDTFMQRGLCDENLNLTEKGQRWVEQSPEALLDPRTSAAIEQACERVVPGMMDDPDREPWSILSEKIASALPAELAQTMQATLEEPTADHVETYADDIRRIEGPDVSSIDLDQAPSRGYAPQDMDA